MGGGRGAGKFQGDGGGYKVLISQKGVQKVLDLERGGGQKVLTLVNGCLKCVSVQRCTKK